jgi:hypothetical protein
MDVFQVALLLVLTALPVMALCSSFRAFVEEKQVSLSRFFPILLSFLLICLGYGEVLLWPLPPWCNFDGARTVSEATLVRMLLPTIVTAAVLGAVGICGGRAPRFMGCGKMHGRQLVPSSLIGTDRLALDKLKQRWLHSLAATLVLLVVCFGIRELIAGMRI